ncbi:hypothetical protein ABZ747_37420 [Kitasatospora cineracea]|uniref:hypothetical protein n=1 Tax=Kitasatospora cineracea TaxID=88074 RepID=UPI0034081235
MTTAYQQALDGTLTSTSIGSTAQFSFNNATVIPLGVYLVSDRGVWLGYDSDGNTFGVGYPSLGVSPGSEWPGLTGQLDYGWYFVFVNYFTGAFVAVLQAASGGSDPQDWVTVDNDDLLDANDIGLPPVPNKGVVIPPDSPRVVVGCGKAGANVIVREQYWRRLPTSYSIARGQKRKENYTTTTGIENTTSDQSDIASAVGAGAGASWGPISASISASLNASSSSFQQVTTSTRTTSSVAQTFDNTEGDAAKMFLHWQLTNVVSVLDSHGRPFSSLIYASEDPAVIGGSYDPDGLPERPLKKAIPMSPQMREILARK